ncbi:MAG: collagen binding domain-containing protein, partial [Christensenella sp.]
GVAMSNTADNIIAAVSANAAAGNYFFSVTIGTATSNIGVLTIDYPYATKASEFLRFLSIYYNDGKKSYDVTDPSCPLIPHDAPLVLAYMYEPQTCIMRTGTPYIFKIPDVFKFEFKIGETSFAVDLKVAGKKVGTVTIDNTNTATLLFTEEIGTGDKGEFWLTAFFDDTKVPNKGEQTVSFDPNINGVGGNITIPFVVLPMEGKVDLTKNGVQKINSLTDMSIEWTLTAAPTVKNNAGNEKITKMVLTDTLPENAVYANDAVITPAITGGTFTHIGADPLSGKGGTLIYTYEGDYLAGNIDCTQLYTIKYTTKVSAADLSNGVDTKFENKVKADTEYPQYDVEKRTNIVKKDDKGAIIPDKSTAPEVRAEVGIAADFLDKTGAVNRANSEINWTVTVNADNYTIAHFAFADNIPKGLTYKPSSLKITPDGAAGGELAVGDFTIVGDAATGTAITYTPTGSTITKQYVIEYTTTFDPNLYDENIPTRFLNTAVINGDGMGNKTKTFEAQVGTSLIAKSGTYDPSTHRITWKLTANSNKIPMSGLKIIDTIPQGQRFVAGSVKSAVNAATGPFTPFDTSKIIYVDGKTTESLTLIMGDVPAAEVHTVVFETEVEDNNVYAVNLEKPKSYTNDVAITFGAAERFSTSGKADVTSTVISKLPKGYDVINKLASWEIDVNQNKMAITNGAVKDDIFAGQRFDEASTLQYQIGTDAPVTIPKRVSNTGVGYTYKYTDEKTPSELFVYLPDMAAGTDSMKIFYKTKIVDMTIFNTVAQPEIFNKATLSGDEIPISPPLPDNVTATSSQVIAKSVVAKAGKQNGVNCILWDVIINNNLLTVHKPVITDVLNEYLIPDTDSIKLYKLTLNSDGKESAPRVEVPMEGNWSADYDADTHTFKFSFLTDISDAYALAFNTDIDEKKAAGRQQIDNAIALDDGEVHGHASSVPFDVDVVKDGSAGNSIRGKIKIVKKDEQGTPLAGACFRVGKITKFTNAAGEAVFDNVKVGTHYVYEVSAPENCVPVKNIAVATVIINKNDDGKTITKEVENTRIKSALKIIKTDTDTGKPIANVKFAVKNNAGTQAYEQYAVTDVNGIAEFKDLLYGSYYYSEITAADGYEIDNGQYAFFVSAADNGKTIEKTMQNKRIPRPSSSPEPTQPAPPEPTQSAPPASTQPAPPSASAPSAVPSNTTVQKAPKTGDGVQLYLYAVTAVLALCVTAIVVLMRKRVR